MSSNKLRVEPATAAAGEATRALLALMARLRDPKDGCPWDVEQTFATIAPYTIEEAYEVADAIARDAMRDLKEELGDLLFQVVFHSRMAEEQGAFGFTDVAEALVAKMIDRHPHVFGDGDARTAAEQAIAWDAQKAQERAAKEPRAGVLDGIPQNLPALMRAEKLTRRAGRIGFDWPSADQVLEKLDEELAELAEARMKADRAAMMDEMGDVLFVLANLARKLDLDPEECLRHANRKFERRFSFIETSLRAAGKAGVRPLDELEALWVEAKKAERSLVPFPADRQRKRAMLISFSGLPGTGKSTIARLLARRTGATILRIDIVDQTLTDVGFRPVRDESYRVCQALAEDNLRLGRIVISDCVNDMAVTREDWRNAALRAGAPCIDVELICSDASEHRRRIETREINIAGFTPPTWAEVSVRQSEPWTRERLIIDTAKLSAEGAVARIEDAIARTAR